MTINAALKTARAAHSPVVRTSKTYSNCSFTVDVGNGPVTVECRDYFKAVSERRKSIERLALSLMD